MANTQVAAARRRGRFGPLTVAQLVVVELVALGLLGARRADAGVIGPWTIGIGAVGALALGAVFLRVRGGWWYQERGPRRRWQRRRAMKVPARATGLPVLGPVAPGLTIRQVEERGTAIGIGQDADGWFAALELDSGPGLAGDRGTDLAVERLARLLSEATSVSVVSHLVTAPSTELDPRSPAAQSYHELLGNAPVAADQARWVAVRLAPSDALAAAAPRGGGLAGVDRAVAALVGRVGKVLSAADVAARPLDRAGLSAALVAASGLSGRPAEPEEQWTTWYADGLAHTCLLITRWPRPSSAELLSRLVRLPAALVSVTVTVHGSGGPPRVQGLVRLSAEPKALARAVDEARTLARRAGAQVRRIDGLHGPGVYASAPTAAVLVQVTA
jgi:type VII secretion protein EccE